MPGAPSPLRARNLKRRRNWDHDRNCREQHPREDQPRPLQMDDSQLQNTLVEIERRGWDSSAFMGAMSSVYRREGDDWRLALYQQTPLPDDND